MSIMSNTEWEIEQINNAIEYYEKAIEDATSYEDHMRYAETVRKLQLQLTNLKGESQPCE